LLFEFFSRLNYHIYSFFSPSGAKTMAMGESYKFFFLGIYTLLINKLERLFLANLLRLVCCL
jgi:hypothetical protein